MFILSVGEKWIKWNYLHGDLLLNTHFISELCFYVLSHQQKLTAASVMLISFFTLNFRKNPGLVCWCAWRLHPSGVFIASSFSRSCCSLFNILKHHLTEIVSLALPALRRQPSLAIQTELELIACHDRKSSLEPFSHMQFHSEKSHCCFSAGDLESTAKANYFFYYRGNSIRLRLSPP